MPPDPETFATETSATETSATEPREPESSDRAPERAPVEPVPSERDLVGPVPAEPSLTEAAAAVAALFGAPQVQASQVQVSQVQATLDPASQVQASQVQAPPAEPPVAAPLPAEPARGAAGAEAENPAASTAPPETPRSDPTRAPARAASRTAEVEVPEREAVLVPRSVRHAGGAAAGARPGTHVVTAKNRWSRVVFEFGGLPAGLWCGLEFRVIWDAREAAGQALDFALAGFDFLAEDGSSLDLDHVPGLARTLLDPHSTWIAGPVFQPGGADAARTGALRIGFRVPDMASALSVTLRSWRNTRPFTVTEAVLRPGRPEDAAPAAPPRRRRLGGEPVVLRYGLVPGMGLVLRGQLYAARTDRHAARVKLVYRDAKGTTIAPPYTGAVSVPALGAMINLAAHQQARRFTLDLEPPPGAAEIELDFGTWGDPGAPAVELLAAPEIALDDRMRLESLCGEDQLDAGAFLARLAERLGLASGAESAWLPAPHEIQPGKLMLTRVRAVRNGPAHRLATFDQAGTAILGLADAPDWALPPAPTWREDPFRSVAWRIEYQSLTWLLPMAVQPGLLGRTLALARAWSLANPWGQPADPLGLHPASLAARAEVFVGLLSMPGGDARQLAGEVARHGFALAEIVGQNTFARSIHQIQAAAALLAVARAMPRLPLAGHWASLARESLREGFEAALSPTGAFADPSPHRRLDLVTLGRVLAGFLGPEAPGPLIAARVEAVLPGLARMLDPGGRLPAFGDSPAGFDHAGWIIRLANVRGGAPARPAQAPEVTTDTLVARHEAPGRGWAYFACTLAEQSPQDHRDCTAFVYSAGGLRWIVDAGGSEGTETGATRHFLLSSQAHNVAIPDGREPMAGGGRLLASLAVDGARAHVLATNVHGPDYRHVRTFVLLDDLSGLAVIDRFDRPSAPDARIAFEGLLHLAPEALVALAGPRRLLAQQGKDRIDLVPLALSGQPAGIEVVCGRDDRPGAIQGFVAQAAGGLQAASALRYAFAGTGTVCGGMLIAADRAIEQRLTRLLAEERLARFLAEA